MKILIGGLFLILILFSCSHPDGQVKLLQQAQQAVENEPSQALNLLDSISNPEKMGEDCYMQYIVVKVQAKYKVHQDITRDTLILEAQKYFENADNQEQAMLANYYAGCLYYGKDNIEKGLEYFNRSEYYAHKTANNLYTGKSLHAKGYVYISKELTDSAIVNYRKALGYYQKCENTALNTLDVIRMIGISYNYQNSLDSAYSYFTEGLQLAKYLDNKDYKRTFTHLLGTNYIRKEKYKEASVYLNKVLGETKKRKKDKGFTKHY